MYVLSVEDIDLMIALVNKDTLPSELIRHEKQMDKLICMGILRPGGGVLALTELGYKTANGLMGRCLGSIVDGPAQPTATAVTEVVVNDEVSAQGTAAAESAEAAAASADSGSEADNGASNADSEAAAEPA